MKDDGHIPDDNLNIINSPFMGPPTRPKPFIFTAYFTVVSLEEQKGRELREAFVR